MMPFVSPGQDFDFLGHDSAFKDRNVALQSVRVGFVPTQKTDIRDLGPMDEVSFRLISCFAFLVLISRKP
jgi:hypothetical protein